MKIFLTSAILLLHFCNCIAQNGIHQETKVNGSKPSKSSDISKEELSIERKVVITKVSEEIVSPKVRMIPKKYEGKGESVYILEEKKSENEIVLPVVMDDNSTKMLPIPEKEPK